MSAPLPLYPLHLLSPPLPPSLPSFFLSSFLMSAPLPSASSVYLYFLPPSLPSLPYTSFLPPFLPPFLMCAPLLVHLLPPTFLPSFISYHLFLFLRSLLLSLSLWRTEVFPHFSVTMATLQQERKRPQEEGGGGDAGVVGCRGGGEAGDVWTMLMLLYWSSVVCVCLSPLAFLPSPPHPPHTQTNPPTQHPPRPSSRQQLYPLFSIASLSFHPHYSHAPDCVLLPVVLKLILHIVLSLLSLLLLYHLAGNVGIHGNLE